MQKSLLRVAKATYLVITGKGTTMVLALFFALFATFSAFISIYAQQAHAAVNSTINFQARVLQANGAVVADGNYSVQFKLYDADSGGTNEWTETQSIAAKNGYITASLGSITSFPGTIDWSQEHWLTMNINGDGEMGPTRMKITAVPYSFKSGQADSLTNGTGTISASQLAQLAPGSIQSVSSGNAALRINQTGAGNLLQLQSGGTDQFTVSNTGDAAVGGSLAVANGITVGNSTSTTAGTIRWTGAVFEGYNGSAWTSLGGSALGNPIINKVKLADEIQNNTVNATATLQNDDELFFAIGANETWTFRFMVQGNANATPDYKFAVTAPGGATCKISTADHEAAVSVANLGCGVSTGLVTGNTANDLYEIIGTVTNGSTAGIVQLQWAQNTANAANSTIYAGSSVLATRAVGANGTAQAFIQNGNSFGAAAFLGTNDNNDLNFITNGQNRLTVQANGNVGVGDTTPTALFTVGTNDALQVNASGDISTSGTLTVTGQTTVSGNIVANGSATGTTATAESTLRTNVTTVTLTAPAFADNDTIFIDNAGQDYYTRIVSGGGTANLTVSPAVSYDANAVITKYNVQNLGATSTDYATQANRFFQGYFLGGIVVGAGSTTISDGNIESTTGLVLQRNGGAVALGGSLSVNGTITGNGSGLTNIDGSQIAGGSIADGSLSANVTLLGNSFNGANQLVQLDGSGLLPVLNGSAITNINASNISSGTVADARLSTNVTLGGNSFNAANGLVQLDGAGALPALNGSAITNLNASYISSGTISSTRLDTDVTLLGNSFNGASQLVQLDASGNLPALNGSALTNLSASSVASGILDNARLSNGVTLLGNSFNGANQLVQLDALGALPALSAGALTNLNATNISSGTIADGRLSGNVGLRDTAQSFTALQTFEANVVLGKDTAPAQAGLITFNDSTVSNGFTSVLGTSTLTANRTINMPDEDGTLCIMGSTSCGFIMLAPGSAQGDSTTNASIFINKTGASGNLITLQKNGTTTLSVLNSGAMQLQLTDASAFVVNNAGGTQIFDIDTTGTGIVRIGGSAADANATLFVLDTKNTAGDPAGTDGASYYNSTLGAMRCYENGQWKNCVDETSVVKTADQTITNNATFQNGTNQAFAMAANSSYTLDAAINFTTTSAAADFKYTFTVPAGAAVYLAAEGPTGANTSTVCNIIVSGQTCSLLVAANYRGTIRVTGYVRTGGTAGNLQFQFAQNTQTAGQSVTVYQGSMLAYRRTQ